MNVAQARKQLHDWLDGNRPWTKSDNMYDVMGTIVDHAELAFTGECRPTRAEVNSLEQVVRVLTEGRSRHPDAVPSEAGLCRCDECMSE
jgi:hypothetical protein